MSDPTSPSTGSPAAARMADTLSDDALIQLFAYDAHAALALHEGSVRAAAGLRVHDLAYASPGGGQRDCLSGRPGGARPVCRDHPPAWRGPRRAWCLTWPELLLPYAIYLAPAGVVSLLIDAPFARAAHARRSAGPFTFTGQDRDEQVSRPLKNGSYTHSMPTRAVRKKPGDERAPPCQFWVHLSRRDVPSSNGGKTNWLAQCIDNKNPAVPCGTVRVVICGRSGAFAVSSKTCGPCRLLGQRCDCVYCEDGVCGTYTKAYTEPKQIRRRYVV
jgi:hypothetical protein